MSDGSNPNIFLQSKQMKFEKNICPYHLLRLKLLGYNTRGYLDSECTP